MEKIYKLLKSKNSGDVSIGIELLLHEDPGYILEFFNKYLEDSTSVRKDIDISIKVTDNIKYSNIYIECGEEHYVLVYHKWLRFKIREGINRSFPVITKEQFINGDYK